MVDIWGWILGYAILFAVVQLAIYAYYVRRGDARPGASAIGEPDDYSRVGDRVKGDPLVEKDIGDATPPDQAPNQDDARACPHCGTVNDTTSTIKYCRHCTRSLG
jgi:ribosomal protein S14